MSAQSSLISSLALHLGDLATETLRSISPSPPRSIREFPSSFDSSGLFVLYAGSGIPITCGVISPEHPESIELARGEVGRLSSMGLVASYRMLETVSPASAEVLRAMLVNLFDLVLPVSMPSLIEQGLELVEPEVILPKRWGRKPRGVVEALVPMSKDENDAVQIGIPEELCEANVATEVPVPPPLDSTDDGAGALLPEEIDPEGREEPASDTIDILEEASQADVRMEQERTGLHVRTIDLFTVPEIQTPSGLPATKAQRREWRRRMLSQYRVEEN